MGIVKKNRDFIIRVFKGSQTHENILEDPYLVANITYDPVTFVQSTFCDLDEQDFEIIPYQGKEFAALRDALSFIVFECKDIKMTSQALIARLEPVYANINHRIIKAPNRGFNAVLEAAVHATRYQLTGDSKYIELIEMYSNLVTKCGGEREKDAMKMIYGFLEID